MVLSDIDINLERSSYYEHRKKLLKSVGTPTLSDCTKNLGGSLAKIVFDQCIPSLKDDFGLDPPLNGPEGDLWISPSDLLIGKVVLKPPLTSKCLQALTHRGILEIGAVVEEKFRGEMELDKKKALEKTRKQLIESLEDRMNAEIKDVEIRERLRCSAEIDKLTKEFDSILLAELDNLENRLKEEHALVLLDQENRLKVEWQENLEREVQKTVHTLTTEFFEKLDEQEQILTIKFKHELRKLQLHHRQDTKMNENITKKILRQVKHYLECKNLANMMYVLCIERRKCCDDKKLIEEYYRNELEKLRETINYQEAEIEKLKTAQAKTIQELELREMCVFKILTQFQKFINFALRASPTQAEFLLSVEKMMVFEMSDAHIKSEVRQVHSDDGILPWVHSHDDSLPSTQSSGVQIKDYHNCMFEKTPPREQSEIGIVGSDEELPAVYYKGKMYVREDFRDMMAAGIKITPSNELWNEDVEILMQTMRASVTKFTPDSAQEKDSGVAVNVKWSHPQQPGPGAKKVSIGDRIMSATSISKPSLSRRSSLKQPSALQHPDDYEPIVPVQATQSKLLAVRDSLEVIKERKNPSSSAANLKLETSSEHIEQIKIVVPLDEHVDIAYETVPLPLQETEETQGQDAQISQDLSNDYTTAEQELKDIPADEILDQYNNSKERRSTKEETTLIVVKTEEDSFKEQFVESEAVPIVRRSSKDIVKTFIAGKHSKDESSSIRDIYQSATHKYSRDNVNGIAKHEPSNNKDLAVEARDSIILRKVSLAKKLEEFHLSPQDSIETRKGTMFKTKHPEIAVKPSKLLSARNSLEMLRQSLMKLREPTPECQKRKLTTISAGSNLSNGASLTTTTCCDKAADFVKKRSCMNGESGIQVLSQIKVIPSDKNISAVAFNKQAVVYDVKVDATQPEEAEDKHRTSLKSSQEAIAMKPNRLKVVGETNAKEGQQTIDEFTTERVHSFIDLIKNHPHLIRLFTSN